MAINPGYASGTRATWGASEFSLINDTTSIATSTDNGMYQLWVDFSTLTTFADQYDIAMYEKVKSGGTQRKEIIATITSPQIWKSPAAILAYGWDFSIKKRTGTDRSIDWTIRRVS